MFGSVDPETLIVERLVKLSVVAMARGGVILSWVIFTDPDPIFPATSVTDIVIVLVALGVSVTVPEKAPSADTIPLITQLFEII
jgi:hypothetical protein